MDFEKLTRKVIALENRNQVNYASVAGNTTSLSKGGTTLGISANGNMTCNNYMVATNLSKDNEHTHTHCSPYRSFAPSGCKVFSRVG